MRGPPWTPITPLTGAFLHADLQRSVISHRQAQSVDRAIHTAESVQVALVERLQPMSRLNFDRGSAVCFESLTI